MKAQDIDIIRHSMKLSKSLQKLYVHKQETITFTCICFLPASPPAPTDPAVINDNRTSERRYIYFMITASIASSFQYTIHTSKDISYN